MNETVLSKGIFTQPLQIIASLAAGLTMLLGLVVIYGWYTGHETLVQVLPEFVPMQYNTALGFVFCALAVVELVSGVSLDIGEVFCS